jgi:hypothetical protein
LAPSGGDASLDQLAGVVREDFIVTAEILDEFNNLVAEIAEQAEDE